MSLTLAILGAGGHAKVVIATAEAAGFEIGGVFDDRRDRWTEEILGYEIGGPIQSEVINRFDGAVIAVGDNSARRELSERLAADWATIVHPSALVHETVQVGSGTVVFAGAILQPDARIGRHCIINTGATVDHDCHVGDFSHIGPGAHLAGEVRIGCGALVGLGAAITPGVRIGDWSTLGAGAVGATDVPGGVTVVGVPAKPLRS